MSRVYTPEMHDFIVEHAWGITSMELTALFNEKFQTDVPPSCIRAYMKNHCIKNGVNRRFQKGHGMNYVCPKGTRNSPATEFKKGQPPLNTKPVGSLRVNSYGYVDRKIADPNVWKCEHQLIWEEAHGPIPKGMRILFLDGNKQNVTLENLALISASERLTMNRMRLTSEDAELTKTGLLVAKVVEKTYQLKEKENDTTKSK